MLLAGIEWSQGIEDAFSDVASFVPKAIGAIAILIIGWIIAKAIRKVVHVVLGKVRFDEAVDRAGLGTHLEKAGYADSGLLMAKLVYYAVMLIVLQMAIGVFGDSPVQDAFDSIVAYLPNVFVAVIIIVIAGAVANAVKGLIEPAVEHISFGNFIASGASIVIWVIGGFAALSQLGVAEQIVNTLFTAGVTTVSLILIIKFGVGGIESARERAWPKLYDRIEAEAKREDRTPTV